ncbi:PLD nuclease N-terminal domain-containing protein [Streptomyces sp. NBC_00859]|uniref:PLD nuclease N-terminal domain-containing protein n=1 Tax=Streptomyces sp. NBC_00859 TaxID=2903682 RepID=UPI00386A1BB6|nr:PLD nuclease N-terminal domain-containing protein [Streptomyces sp. NBC_00859]
MLRYLPFLLVLALWIYAFIDCLNTPEEEVRGLPKVVWVLVILLFGEVLVGPVAWIAVGRARRGTAGAAPGRGRRGGWTAPDDNPEFLDSLRADNKQAEQLLQDREADLRRRENELRRRESGEDAT